MLYLGVTFPRVACILFRPSHHRLPSACILFRPRDSSRPEANSRWGCPRYSQCYTWASHFLVSRAFYFAQAIPSFLARDVLDFARGTYLAQRRTRDGGVRGIACAIPGRHPRGARVDVVRIVLLLLGEVTPASFAWPHEFRPGLLARRVRRKLSRAARRATFFFPAAPAARARARAPCLFCLICLRSFPTWARAAPISLL